MRDYTELITRVLAENEECHFIKDDWEIIQFEYIHNYESYHEFTFKNKKAGFSVDLYKISTYALHSLPFLRESLPKEFLKKMIDIFCEVEGITNLTTSEFKNALK
jgi:hypothetical protein